MKSSLFFNVLLAVDSWLNSQDIYRGESKNENENQNGCEILMKWLHSKAVQLGGEKSVNTNYLLQSSYLVSSAPCRRFLVKLASERFTTFSRRLQLDRFFLRAGRELREESLHKVRRAIVLALGSGESAAASDSYLLVDSNTAVCRVCRAKVCSAFDDLLLKRAVGPQRFSEISTDLSRLQISQQQICHCQCNLVDLPQ